MGKTTGRGRTVRAAAVAAVGALALTVSAPPASAGTVGDALSGTLGLVGGVVKANGFQLGLFDEFADQAPAVRLGQARTSINGAGADAAGYDGSGIDVAVIDTGAVPVPGLDAAAAITNGPDLSFDHQGGLAAGLDGYGHGTHMAGIIAGRGSSADKGIADSARIVNLKVGASNGAVDVSQVIAAVDWVVANRRANGLNIRVLNLSYGTDAIQDARVDPLAHAIESAWRNGIVVVVAAGNTGGALTNPALDPHVLTVGAAQLNDPLLAADDTVAAFSAVGTATRRVDVVAPGRSIVSLRDPGSAIDDAHPEARVGTTGFRGSGTSQAAAVASGAVASLLEARPTLTPDQVKAVLRSSARRLLLSPATSQGAGMIDLGAALKATVGTGAQTAARSTGLGSLEAARGTVHVTIDGVVLRGERDVQSMPWVPSLWAPRAATGTAWIGGTWNGQVWTGTSWSGDASPWVGRTWKSATWTGRTWKGDAWSGRTWKGDAWTGRTWKST